MLFLPSPPVYYHHHLPNWISGHSIQFLFIRSALIISVKAFFYRYNKSAQVRVPPAQYKRNANSELEQQSPYICRTPLEDLWFFS
jgi:hypothetical protein